MDLKTARDATGGASVLTIIGAVISLFNTAAPIEARVIMSLILLVIALGVWKLFRTAAIIAFVLACVNIVGFAVMIFRGYEIKPPLFAPVLLYLGVWVKWSYKSVRAAFAYRRFRSAAR